MFNILIKKYKSIVLNEKKMLVPFNSDSIYDVCDNDRETLK